MGFDFYSPVNYTTDSVFGFSLLKDSYSGSSFSKTSDTGNSISLDTRHQLSETTELGFGVSGVGTVSDSSTVFGIDIEVEIFDKTLLGFGYAFNDDGYAFGFGIRNDF